MIKETEIEAALREVMYCAREIVERLTKDKEARGYWDENLRESAVRAGGIANITREILIGIQKADKDKI